MQIEQVETFIADEACIVRLRTDTGLSGIGQGTYFVAPVATQHLIELWAPALIGQDPAEIERHWLRLYRASSHRSGIKGSALAAIDMALWDLAGKRFGVPVAELLGGFVRRSVRLYLNLLRPENEDQIVARARAAVRSGYTAVKIDAVPLAYLDMTTVQLERQIELRLRLLRETVGPDVDIALELHNRLTFAQAISLSRRLGDLRLMFVEDPIPPESPDALGELARRFDVPLASGERLVTLHEFKDLLLARGAAIIRPDIGIAGGISNCKKIAALAEAHHIGVAPHHTLAPIAAAAELQLDACIPNFVIQSYLDDHLASQAGLLKQRLLPRDGYMEIPTKPGLGIELDDVYVATHAVTPYVPDSPIAADGSPGYA